VQNFCEQKGECPQLYQESLLFDSSIFEYGNPNSSHGYKHILVWLFFTEEKEERYYSKADENLSLFYQEFIDLFFYRNKVIKAYHLSRDVYLDIHSLYKEFKQTVREIANIQSIENNSLVTNTNRDLSSEIKRVSPQNKIVPKMSPDNNLTVSNKIRRLSDIELKNYQDKLSIFPLLDLEYSEYLTEFDKYCLTIETNTKNYAEKLRQIQQKSANENLHFLSNLNQIISVKFSNQIQTDLGYFANTPGLIDKAITSIRGIVEIEQAERDRSLENTVQVLGIAFGGGAIVSGVVTQNINKPFVSSYFKYPISPLALSLFWSIAATIIFGIVALLVTQPKRKKNKQK